MRGRRDRDVELGSPRAPPELRNLHRRPARATRIAHNERRPDRSDA
jgi:hypothetical protein